MGSSISSGGEETVLDTFGDTVWGPLFCYKMCNLSCCIAYMLLKRERKGGGVGKV